MMEMFFLSSKLIFLCLAVLSIDFLLLKIQKLMNERVVWPFKTQDCLEKD